MVNNINNNDNNNNNNNEGVCQCMHADMAT
jgi:hypothetical protein